MKLDFFLQQKEKRQATVEEDITTIASEIKGSQESQSKGKKIKKQKAVDEKKRF